MKEWYSMRFTKVMYVLLLILSVFLISCTSNPDADISIDYCETADDCIPNKCCHPDGAINKQFEQECESEFCTLSCDTLLDCGDGHIECIENRCVVVANE